MPLTVDFDDQGHIHFTRVKKPAPSAAEQARYYLPTLIERVNIWLFDIPFDLAQLPSVALSATRTLPRASGVYFALDTADTVLYVGQSTNIRQRWYAHDKKQVLAAKVAHLGTPIRIAWLACAEPGLVLMERVCLAKYCPPYN